MKLADKQAYPSQFRTYETENYPVGLTFRERLIVALASNSSTCEMDFDGLSDDLAIHNAKDIIKQADAIIKQLEEEKK